MDSGKIPNASGAKDLLDTLAGVKGGSPSDSSREPRARPPWVSFTDFPASDLTQPPSAAADPATPERGSSAVGRQPGATPTSSAAAASPTLDGAITPIANRASRHQTAFSSGEAAGVQFVQQNAQPSGGVSAGGGGRGLGGQGAYKGASPVLASLMQRSSEVAAVAAAAAAWPPASTFPPASRLDPAAGYPEGPAFEGPATAVKTSVGTAGPSAASSTPGADGAHRTRHQSIIDAPGGATGVSSSGGAPGRANGSSGPGPAGGRASQPSSPASPAADGGSPARRPHMRTGSQGWSPRRADQPPQPLQQQPQHRRTDV